MSNVVPVAKHNILIHPFLVDRGPKCASDAAQTNQQKSESEELGTNTGQALLHCPSDKLNNNPSTVG